MAKVISWPNLEVARRRLEQRLKAAKEERKRLVEIQWLRNEQYLYKNDPALSQTLNPLGGVGAGLDTEEFDDPEFVEISYVFKDMRYLHAELSSNPPMVQATPLSSDLDSRHAARAGGQICGWALRKYNLQEVYDLTGLDCLVYGIGIAESTFDHELGAVREYDKEVGEVKMAGDIYTGRVSPWDFFPAPRTQSRLSLPWVFKRFRISVDAFLSRWPELRDLLQKRLSESTSTGADFASSGNSTHSGLDTIGLRDTQKDEIELFEYWETGLPENGQQGRYAICFEDGTLVVPPTVSPMALPEPLTLEERRDMRAAGSAPRRRPKQAVLPFHIWTDIDVPGRLWGKSFLEYAGPNQELMNNLDSALLELVKTHGLFRLILPAGAQLEEGGIENDPGRIIKLKSNPNDGGKVDYIPPAGVPPSMAELRAMVRGGIDDLAGVTEANFGTQSRETSGFSMQYAVNQSRMIRRRLFNKSVLFVESLYWTILRLGAYHWDDPQMIEVLGKEHAFDSVSLRGVDFDGGYKLKVEYGTDLPLDPDLRRDTLLKWLPVLQAAQVPAKMILQAIRFGDFNRLRDAADLAEDRQNEAIEQIIATGKQVEIRKHMDHEGMTAWLKYYVMTSDYRDLPDEVKDLIDEQIDLHASAAAELRPPAPPPAPGMSPTPGSPPPAAPSSGPPSP